jgi:hypothetical protein
MDFRGLQPAAGRVRRVVFDFRDSEILTAPQFRQGLSP